MLLISMVASTVSMHGAVGARPFHLAGGSQVCSLSLTLSEQAAYIVFNIDFLYLSVQ
jgi:hypothetical protein